jgi:hypothetical protein
MNVTYIKYMYEVGEMCLLLDQCSSAETFADQLYCLSFHICKQWTIHMELSVVQTRSNYNGEIVMV